jgi:hypothetical protein
MQWSILLLTVAPSIAYATAVFLSSRTYRGAFFKQARIVLAGSSDFLQRRIDEYGGARVVRGGIYLDYGYMAFVYGPAIVFLWWSAAPGLSLLPVAGAIFDLTENLLLARATNKSPTDRQASTLFHIALLKFIIYGSIFGAVLAACALP